MKKISIKLRITLFFTLILFLLSAAMMSFIVVISNASANAELENTLQDKVNELYALTNYKPLRQQDMQPPMPPGEGGKVAGGASGGSARKEYTLEVPSNYNYSSGDVSLYIYSANATYGALFEGLSFDPTTAKNEAFSKQQVGDSEYLIYSRYVKESDKKDGGAWVVGAIDKSIASSISYRTVSYALFSLPIVILLAAALGYAVTKRAFKPVTEITNAANEISKGGDLSKRINLGESKDEIYELANTFDTMLDTIQHNFERERQFTNDASHELRTPISIIMAQSELALGSKATDSDRTEALESINRQSRRINKLLAELLSLARSDNGKTVLEKELFDLTELAEMVVTEKRGFAECRGISLNVTSTEPVEVLADQTLIMRVLINLITNSVKYGKDGGYTEISVERRGENGVVCRVKDNGIGISEENIGNIWNRFFRVDTARTYDKDGSFGLGLPVVKTIVEAHGGTVGVESTLGEGSVFTFTI